MVYEFKTKFVKNINEKQKEYISQKKRVYNFKNRRRVDPYKVAQSIDTASSTSIKTAIEFAGLKDLME